MHSRFLFSFPFIRPVVLFVFAIVCRYFGAFVYIALLCKHARDLLGGIALMTAEGGRGWQGESVEFFKVQAFIFTLVGFSRLFSFMCYCKLRFYVYLLCRIVSGNSSLRPGKR